MVKEDFLQNLLGSALVAAGGEVPLDHVQSLFKEKFDAELPYDSNHGALEKYLVTNFSNICRVKKAMDGHFVVRVLRLPSIAHLLPTGYNEPEFEPITSPDPQIPFSPPASKTPPMTQHSQQSCTDRQVVKHSPVKFHNYAYRSRYSALFKKNEYQDEPDASERLADLEHQLAQECSVRGIVEPTFNLTTSGGELREVFCVASWGDEKIQSHPGVFATEEGAKASLVKKMLAAIDIYAERIPKSQTAALASTMRDFSNGTSDSNSLTAVAEILAGTEIPAVAEIPAAETPVVTQQEQQHIERKGHGDVVDFEQENSVDLGAVGEDGDVQEGARNALLEADDPSSYQLEEELKKKADDLLKNLQIMDRKLPLTELEPYINTEEPLSQGFLTYVMEDASLVVQVKGPGLDKWERQTYAFDPRAPVENIIPFRWYVVQIFEPGDVHFYDRAMCLTEDRPYYDERGFVQLNFPDNGYGEFVDPSTVFELSNYDEINRLPAQGLLIHAIGLTGSTPVEELQVSHPPHHPLLFLPADRSDCFMNNCAVDVPHVYVYDIASKRVLC